MAGGLVALLDDVALIARMAAANIDDVGTIAGKTTAKAAGVVIDDAAVTPKFVAGVQPARELPIIWRITKGSLVNKLLIILPIAMLLSTFAPWALTPLLMLGGLYLSFEGAEKIVEFFRGGHQDAEDKPKDEDTLIKGAVMTDFILSAEIMVISLSEVADQSIWLRLIVLIVVGLMVTLGVYGAVGLLVKIDDIGLVLSNKDSSGVQKLGRGMVAAMPKILNTIAFIGTFAMLWVGGHILLAGMDELGWHWPYQNVHHLMEALAGMGAAMQWGVETFFSMIAGLLIGFVIVGIIHLLHFGKKH